MGRSAIFWWTFLRWLLRWKMTRQPFNGLPRWGPCHRMGSQKMCYGRTTAKIFTILKAPKMGRFEFFVPLMIFWSCPLVGCFRWTSPVNFQECREIAQENFVGGKWKALFWVGCVVSDEQRRKKWWWSFWKIQKIGKKNDFFWGGWAQRGPTEILFSSCWGAIWLVQIALEPRSCKVIGNYGFRHCGSGLGLLRSFRMDDWWWSLN